MLQYVRSQDKSGENNRFEVQSYFLAHPGAGHSRKTSHFIVSRFCCIYQMEHIHIHSLGDVAVVH